MSSVATQAAGATVCVNHPQTETLLRCNKCGRPVCIKCVDLTPVGYRCKDCLHVQRAGYYNATAFDHVIAGIVGTILGAIGGAIMGVIGFWLLAIFAGPAAGGMISESIRAAVQKRRGRYLWLVACAAVVVGGLVGLMGPTLLPLLAAGRMAQFARFATASFVNIGFWIFIALAVSTVYARLRI